MNNENVISYFKKICSIPRSSGDEAAAADYIAAFAARRGLPVQRDARNNLIIRKPGNIPGADPVILQGHLDMVYVKENGCDHRYEDGITVLEDADFFYADGTSLGADNGIAIAYCLAILDSTELRHPDLEVIFTVQEETGLGGAAALDISGLHGSRLINLDSEEEGVFYTSCAGGLRCRMIWNPEKEPLAGKQASIHIEIRELLGGHSGINIAKGRGNSLILLGRLCHMLLSSGVRLSNIQVNGKANAIANTGSIDLCTEPGQEDTVLKKIQQAEEIFREELRYTDHVTLETTVKAPAEGAEAFTGCCADHIVNSLLLLPCGVFGMSFAMPDLVETSMSLGSLTSEPEGLTLLMSIRSSVDSQKYFLRDKIRIIADQFADGCIFENDYPAWQYRNTSSLRDKAVEIYERQTGKKARFTAIHAGLECGYWAGKRPDLDIISIGPDLFDVHSPKEHASKASVQHVWELLTELLAEL